jgi:hypothetical protein
MRRSSSDRSQGRQRRLIEGLRSRSSTDVRQPHAQRLVARHEEKTARIGSAGSRPTQGPWPQTGRPAEGQGRVEATRSGRRSVRTLGANLEGWPRDDRCSVTVNEALRARGSPATWTVASLAAGAETGRVGCRVQNWPWTVAPATGWGAAGGDPVLKPRLNTPINRCWAASRRSSGRGASAGARTALRLKGMACEPLVP